MDPFSKSASMWQEDTGGHRVAACAGALQACFCTCTNKAKGVHISATQGEKNLIVCLALLAADKLSSFKL